MRALFVVMLVNLDVALKQAQFSRQWLVAALAAAALTAQLVYGIYLDSKKGFPLASPMAGVEAPKNTTAIAIGLYQTYMLPVEIASLLLLVAMVGAVVMAKRKFE